MQGGADRSGTTIDGNPALRMNVQFLLPHAIEVRSQLFIKRFGKPARWLVDHVGIAACVDRAIAFHFAPSLGHQLISDRIEVCGGCVL
jgi:hypothetical protein